jgi:signal transduction histidine kinase
MPLWRKATDLAGRLRRRRTTVRGRLTLLYGTLFLASGAVLLALIYGGTSARSVTQSFHASGSFAGPPPFSNGTVAPGPAGPAGSPAAILVSNQRGSDLHQLLLVSGIALALMAVISMVLGLIVAGRVLRPLQAMTATTKQITAENLHQRLGLDGPSDELKELGDTIDGLLGRLEDAFDAQRRFVANASHELRTPLTVARALLEMTLGDPQATVESFRTTARQAIEAGEQQEQLIDALLMLARSQRGLDNRQPLDLAVIAGGVVAAHEADAAARGLRLNAWLDSAPVSGDPRLVERLISNLVENAVRHNIAGGRVQVLVETRDGRPTLKVENTGPTVPAGEIPRLLQPFQRVAPERVGEHDGHGLGLSIVAAIAKAHHAALDVRPGADGGLAVEVRFQRVATTPELA